MRHDLRAQNEEHAAATIPDEIAAILRCPACKEELRQSSQQEYYCCHCSGSFPVTDRVMRFVDTTNYAENFGFEWQLYSRTQLDTQSNSNSEAAFRQRTGLTPQDLNGKLVLDVGCGMGRLLSDKQLACGLRHRGHPGRRPEGQFRHDVQAAACRHGIGARPARRAACRSKAFTARSDALECDQGFAFSQELISA